MIDLEGRSGVTDYTVDEHVMKIIELKEEEFEALVSELVKVLPAHYISPESTASTLERLGKEAAANKLRIKLPEVMKIRSGDIGEVITTEFIEESTGYHVPIRKLRWRDHRDMAMRGDDVIGIVVDMEGQSLRFLKTEAKSNKSLSNAVLDKARYELDMDDGLPAPHALAFVAERLRGMGKVELADLIEKVQLVDGIKSEQVEHLLFTFTASNPATLQKKSFESYAGDIRQISIGFRVIEHQKLISDVYKGVIDGLD